MSGSTRAITLSISVKDADTVLTTLRNIGPAGEDALARLEAAAQKAAGRGGGGGMAQLATATQNTTTQFRSMTTVVQQGGFQLQDFFVQVQGGTSALTALSQQGSQFLGIFGPGGAVAGAVLAIGALAAGLLTGSQNANVFRNSEESLAAAFRASKEVVDALIASTRNLANERRNAAIAEVQVEVGRARLAQDRIETERTSILGENALARRAGGALDQGLVTQNQQRIDELNQRAQRAGQIADRLQQDLDNLTNLRRFDGLRDPRDGEGSGGGNVDEMLAAAQTARDRARREAEAAARAAAAAGRRNAAAAGRDANLSQTGIDAGTRADADAVRDYEAALRSVENPMERYTRRVEELSALQVRLQEAGTPMRPEDDARLYEAISKELEDATNRTSGLNSAARELGMTFSSAFEDAVIKGKALSDVLKGVAEDLARIILRQAVVQPLAGAASSAATAAGNYLGSLFSPSTATGATYGAGGYTGAGPFTASALGNAFSGGRLIPFATGGVVDRATVMPMALMGEAGPEAVVPLKRGKDGKLGIAGGSGGGSSITQNITIDARGADPTVVPLIRTAMAQVKREARAELLAEIQRGGQAAKIVGRRA